MLYDKICGDRGLTLELDYGSEQHREEVANDIASCEIFRTPGARTSLKQWLSWVGCMHSFMRSWHCMLLGVSYSMLKSGACDIDSLPLFGMALKSGPKDGQRKQEGGDMDRPVDRDAGACSEEEVEAEEKPSDDRQAQLLRE